MSDLGFGLRLASLARGDPTISGILQEVFAGMLPWLYMY